MKTITSIALLVCALAITATAVSPTRGGAALRRDVAPEVTEANADELFPGEENLLALDEMILSKRDTLEKYGVQTTKKYMTINSPLYIKHTFFAKAIKSPTGNLTIESTLKAPAMVTMELKASSAFAQTVNTDTIVSSAALNLNKDLNVPGVVSTPHIKSPTGVVRVDKDLTVDHQVKAKHLEAPRVTATGAVEADNFKPPSGTAKVFGDAQVAGTVTCKVIDSPGRNLTIRGDITVVSSVTTPSLVAATIYAKSNKTINVQGSMVFSGAVRTKTIRAIGKSVTIDGDLAMTGDFRVGAMDAQVIKSNTGMLKVIGDLAVTQSMTVDSIKTPSGILAIDGSISVNGALKTDTFEAQTTSTSLLQTDVAVAPSGTLNLKSHLTADNVNVNSLNSGNLRLGGVNQWQVVAHDDFENAAQGWNGAVSQEGAHSFIGGHCNKLENGEVSKTFEGLPPHSSLQLASRVHFLDNWDGATAFAAIDGTRVWADSYTHGAVDSAALNIVGNSKFGEKKFGIPVTAVVPHSGDKVTVTFGSNLKANPCDASMGIDDVVLLVK